ncbi:hypothetical protein [Rhizobium ruizarguesonis]|jgi:hypothetical protein|uniref:hypothetical protein n=1 Tax=Rhizobium ruizarguesonis TaxID=2081791 RepID=UPI0010315115|nr:hypothetical protein [Rhizobium ruizarguesonis]TBC51036.1 hypothetical protein ELH29_15285 [Rhizobium ruizarguesonis]
MSIEYLTDAVGLASAAIGMTGKAVSTADAIKKLFASDKAPDKSEAAKLVGELAAELTAANITNLKLSEALHGLSEELRKEDQFEKEMARYAPYQTAEDDIVYKVREEFAGEEPIHFICPACLKKDRLFIFITGKGDYKHCQLNHTHTYHFGSTQWPSRRRRAGIA